MSDKKYTDDIETADMAEDTDAKAADAYEIDDEEGYEKYCSLCHRPESVAGKLIESADTHVCMSGLYAEGLRYDE